MSSFNVPIRVPAECMYNDRLMKGRLGSDSNVSYKVVQPVGGSQSIAMSQIASIFVANSGAVSTSTSSVLTQFLLPCGANMTNQVLDSNYTMVNGKVKVVIDTASSATNAVCHLVSSMASIIGYSQDVVNGAVINTVAHYGLLQDLLLCLYLSYSERTGVYSAAWACDDFSFTSGTIGGTNGLQIMTTSTGTKYISFSFPILSIWGILSNTQFIPLERFNGNIGWNMYNANIVPIASYCSAVTTAGALTLTIQDLQLMLKVIDLGTEAGRMLSESIGPNLNIKVDCWTSTPSTINSGSSGNPQLSIPVRKNSVRSIFTTFGVSTVSGTCLNGLYDKIVPGGLSDVYWLVNSVRKPQYSLNPVQNPALVFQQMLDATGNTTVHSHRGLMNRYNYLNGNVDSTALTNDESFIFLANGLRTLPDGQTCSLAKAPACFILGLNTETSNSPSMFCGVSTLSMDMYLVCNFSVSVGSNNITATHHVLYDGVLTVDEAYNVNLYT